MTDRRSKIDKKIEKVKMHFEKEVDRYKLIVDKKSSQHYLDRRKELLKEFSASNTQNKIILDLAAGMGIYLDSLSNYKYLINIDLSFNELKEISKEDDRVLCINANALNIPFRNSSIDSIIIIGLLHHIPFCFPELFQEIVRVLKNDGTVLIEEPNGYNILWFIYMKLYEIDKVRTRPPFPHTLKKFAKKYSLKVEKEVFWGFMPPIDNKFVMDAFNKIETFVEDSFLSSLCTRYLLILKK
jgi:ubiquinone/menaquinone biosynthesis C-methylase UbiE